MGARYGQPKDYTVAKNIWKRCFIDSQEEIDFYFENIYDEKNYLVLEENGEIKASLHENKYTLSINGNLIPSFYIVAVAVLPEFRKKGYMRELLFYSLNNARKNGYSFIYLSAINSDIYRKFGFEYVSEIENYSLDIGEIFYERIDRDIEIKYITEENFQNYLEELIKIYEKEMSFYDMYVKRDKRTFANLLKEVFSDSGEVYIFYKNNIPKGYLIFYREEKITVREMFGEDRDIVENILAFIKSFKEYYSKVEINCPQGKNLNFYFKNQKKIEKKDKPFAMGRIINVLEFFKNTKFNLKNIRILVVDELITFNNGVYSFNKKGEVEFFNSGEWDLKIDIGSLTSLVLGYLDIDTFIFMNRADVKKINQETKNVLKSLSLKKNFIQDYQ